MTLSAKQKVMFGYWLTLALVLGAGCFFYRNADAEQRRHIDAELTAIARLKCDQIASWREERLADATVMMRGPYLRERVSEFLRAPTAEDERKFLVRFRTMAEQYKYSDVRLVDLDGKTRVSVSGADRPHEAVEKAGMAEAVQSRRPVLVDVHRVPGESSPRLTVIAPIFPDETAAVQCVIFFEIDASRVLFPVVQSWPVPTRTGRAVLVRVEGGEAVMLTDSAAQQGTALKVRKQLSDTRIASVMAAQGTRGLVEAVDFRGVPVLAVLDAVPHSPWLLVTKKDAADAFEPLTRLMWFSASIVGLIVLSITLAYFFVANQLALTESIREEREKLSVTLHSIGDAVLTTGPDGRVTLMNEVAEKLTGWTQAEAVGEPVGKVFKIIDESSRLPGVVPVDAALATGETQFLQEITVLISRGGGEHPIADSAAPIRGGDGRTLGVVLVFRDVTEERNSRAALLTRDRRIRLAMDSARIGDWELELPSMRVVRRSLLHDQMFGYVEPVAEWTFPIFLSHVRPEDRARVEQTVRDGVAARGFAFECRIIRADDQSEGWIWVRAQVFTEQGRSAFALGLVMDITERKRAEEAIVEANANVEEANKELEAFNYSVSHDLRAPLRAIDGWSQALAEDCAEQLDARGKEYLGRVREGAGRMGRLIDDFLKMSRMSRAAMSKTSLDLSAIISAIGARLAQSQPEREVQFIVQPGMVVNGDRGLIEAAMTNLLENAWKFTGKRASARVEAGSKVVDGETVYFVRDNGAGFDMAYAKSLFAPFRRLHKSEDFPGTGVGLSTVKRIIARHGGRMWAEAAPDVGAAFFFTLK